jgi:hypothetical protein
MRTAHSNYLKGAAFGFASFLTACFTVVMRRAELAPLHAAALVSSGSLVIYLPIYLALCGTRVTPMPVASFAVQAIFEGITVTMFLLFCTDVQLLSLALAAARPLELWCPRSRHSSHTPPRGAA